jgi:hypothetical protein
MHDPTTQTISFKKASLSWLNEHNNKHGISFYPKDLREINQTQKTKTLCGANC